MAGIPKHGLKTSYQCGISPSSILNASAMGEQDVSGLENVAQWGNHTDLSSCWRWSFLAIKVHNSSVVTRTDLQ